MDPHRDYRNYSMVPSMMAGSQSSSIPTQPQHYSSMMGASGGGAGQLQSMGGGQQLTGRSQQSMGGGQQPMGGGQQLMGRSQQPMGGGQQLMGGRKAGVHGLMNQMLRYPVQITIRQTQIWSGTLEPSVSNNVRFQPIHCSIYSTPYITQQIKPETWPTKLIISTYYSKDLWNTLEAIFCSPVNRLRTINFKFENQEDVAMLRSVLNESKIGTIRLVGGLPECPIEVFFIRYIEGSMNDQFIGYISLDQVDGDDPYFVKATAEGSGHLKPAVVVMYGPPGAGKTSVKQLILGRPPVTRNEQNNTGVVERPIRTCRIKSRGVDILHEVKRNEFLQMLAEDVNESSPSSSHTAPSSVSTQPLSSDVPSVSPPPNIAQLEEPILEPNTFQSAMKSSKIVNDIKELISSGSKSSRDLFDLDWIHLVDSGGQPQFADILPFLFQSEEALYIVVIRLDQDLNVRHNNLYCANGVNYQLPETLELTNHQLIERACQIAEAQSTESSQKKVIVVATRLDLVTNPEDCVKTLNEELLELQKKYPNALVAKDVTMGKIAFTVNAMATGDERKMYVNELQKCLIAIVKRSIKPIEVPLRWFVYELELEQESQSSHGVLEKSKCLKIGAVLSMNPEEVEESLRFFNRIAIHLYHPDIHDLVLTRMDPLTDRLSALVQTSFLPPQFHSIGDSSKLKKVGLFKKSYLPVAFENISDGHCISDDAFLKITRYLSVIVKVGLDDYFIPSALSVNTEHNVTDQPYTPCTFSWGDRIIPPGFFFSLIITLLHLVNERSFKYFYLATENISQSRDRITVFSKAYGGRVTFFNQQKYIWVHYTGGKPDLTDYIKVLKLVVVGLRLAIRNSTKIREGCMKFPSVSCFCPVCDVNGVFHPCVFNSDRDYCICPSDPSKMVPLPKDMKQIMDSLQDVIDTGHIHVYHVCVSTLSSLYGTVAAADCDSLGNDECRHVICSSELIVPQAASDGRKRAASQRESGLEETDSKKDPADILSQSPSTKEAFDCLRDHSGLYDEIARELGISAYERGCIRTDIMMDANRRLEEILHKWIEQQTVEVSWRALINACKHLEHPDIVTNVETYIGYSSQAQPND